MNERPPAKFWEDFTNFVKATLPYDDSDEYWTKLIKWANILQRRYHGNVITGKVILDYLDQVDRWLREDDRFPEYKRAEIA